MPRRGKAPAIAPQAAEQADDSTCSLLALHDHEPALLQQILEAVQDLLALFRLTRACARLHSLMQPQMHTLLPPLQYPAAEDLVARPARHRNGTQVAVWADIFTARPSEELHDLEAQASLPLNPNSKKWRKRLERALAHGPSINSLLIKNKTEFWDDGPTALGAAVRSGYAPVVRFLLLRGADPNQFDGKGRRPLHRALESRGSLIAGGVRDPRAPASEIVQMLLRAGADPTLTTVRITGVAFHGGATELGELTPMEVLHERLGETEQRLRAADFSPDGVGDNRPFWRSFLGLYAASLRGCVPVLQAPPPPHRMRARATPWELPTA